MYMKLHVQIHLPYTIVWSMWNYKYTYHVQFYNVCEIINIYILYILYIQLR